jgi:hypothetical protein
VKFRFAQVKYGEIHPMFGQEALSIAGLSTSDSIEEQVPLGIDFLYSVGMYPLVMSK